MSKLTDARETLRKLANLPMIKAHFAWGPLNTFVLLVGAGITGGLLHRRGELSGDVGIALGVASLFLLIALNLGRRWDQVLAGIVIIAIALELWLPDLDSRVLLIGLAVSGIAACAVQVVSHWDKAILLRLGEFRGLRGPGPFLMLPFLERVEDFVDQRVRVTDFRAERILTLDTVPVFVDAICFWLVWSAEKAVLEVEDYRQAVILSAQTALKDAVGRHELSELLSERHKLGNEIQHSLEEKTSPWGVTIQSIEITDVVIPEGLEEAMSRRAQADRERQARIILATAETEISEKFAAAARSYREDPTALHLRAMNMVYEGIRQKGAMIIVPSSALDTMGLGSVPGLAALARESGADDGGGAVEKGEA